MSNISLVIEERATSIGHFMVGRLLPFRQKRSVGPFVFMDHMGPARMDAGEHLDVGAHPHIGLSTLTYLFEGAILHKDSLGSEVEMEPGAVNWMTAGKGVVHSERTPDRYKNSTARLHGLQIWVALPKELEDTEPSFSHIPSENIPVWEENGVQFTLIAGEALGKKSPVPVYSPLYFIDIKNKARSKVQLGDLLYGESALYILEGSVFSEGQTYESRHILIAKDTRLCEFEMAAESTVYIFGGEPFPEERFIDWNFVSSSKEKIIQAKEHWIQNKFLKIDGESTYIPYPERKKPS